MGLTFCKRRENGLKGIQFGMSTFSIEPDQINDLQDLNKKNWQMLESSQWNIENYQYQIDQWKDIFPTILTTKIQKLSLYNNKEEKIIKEIAHINFNNLQMLALGKNSINNIQALSFLDLHSLKMLRLNENNITNFQPLIKLNSRHLNSLVIAMNPYIVLREFHRISFNCEQGKDSKLLLQVYSKYGDPPKSFMHDDMAFLMKVSIRGLSILNIAENKLRKKHLKVFTLKNSYLKSQHD